MNFHFWHVAPDLYSSVVTLNLSLLIYISLQGTVDISLLTCHSWLFTLDLSLLTFTLELLLLKYPYQLITLDLTLLTCHLWSKTLDLLLFIWHSSLVTLDLLHFTCHFWLAILDHSVLTWHSYVICQSQCIPLDFYSWSVNLHWSLSTCHCSLVTLGLAFLNFPSWYAFFDLSVFTFHSIRERNRVMFSKWGSSKNRTLFRNIAC